MSYQKANGGFADTEDCNLHPSATRTATVTTSAIELGDKGTARLVLDVTAASGTTPTLDVTIQTSRDRSTWYTAGTFAQKTGTGTERKGFVVDRHVRAVCTIGGTTPSFTFAVTGEGA